MRKQKLCIFILLIFSFAFSAFSEASEKSVAPEQIEAAEQSIKSAHEALAEMILSEKTDEEVFDFLKKLKISKKEINQKDENGYSPLYLVLDMRRDSAIVKLLISKGADKNQISNITIRDNSGSKILRCSPIFYAAWKGNSGSIRVLMDKKADVEIESDFIRVNKKTKTYYRLLRPIDVAIYNKENINFDRVYKVLSQKPIDVNHSHFVGSKNKYEEVKTKQLLEEIEESK